VKPPLSKIAGADGPGTSRTIGDRSWTIIRSTKDIQIRWGEWYANRVEASVLKTAASYRKDARDIWRDVERWRTELMADEEPTPDRGAELASLVEDGEKAARFLEFEARAIVERFNDRRGAGEFEYHGNASLTTAMQNLPGQFYLAWLCLQPNHPKITLEEVVEAFQGHAQEWGKLLVDSEGAQKKKLDPSTPTSTETTETTASSIPSPTPQTQAPP